ncbi:helix-turn-helix domain-containing protein [Burkholderia ubonensis]|uniref:helix-turn-helix domain-containing protein n=1 Tax=Burkholderia ubonensis TaxID=101571 RepID=UPI0009B49DE8|nr:helix-turn-helix domain-containing protein [Burkholderia ubonensis]
MTFLRGMRLEYGRWQLTNNRISLTQITLDCGFSDGVHFPRDFRDRFGVSPRSLQQLAQSRTQTETSVSTVRCEVDGRTVHKQRPIPFPARSESKTIHKTHLKPA